MNMVTLTYSNVTDEGRMELPDMNNGKINLNLKSRHR
jgi:hypothetical protein